MIRDLKAANLKEVILIYHNKDNSDSWDLKV